MRGVGDVSSALNGGNFICRCDYIIAHRISDTRNTLDPADLLANYVNILATAIWHLDLRTEGAGYCGTATLGKLLLESCQVEVPKSNSPYLHAQWHHAYNGIQNT
eukprot:3281151-Pleurochrysis_carterae.AAC.6